MSFDINDLDRLKGNLQNVVQRGVDELNKGLEQINNGGEIRGDWKIFWNFPVYAFYQIGRKEIGNHWSYRYQSKYQTKQKK